MTIKRLALPLAISGLALSGCVSVADKEFVGYQDPGFGEANRATYAAMVVDPDPQYDTPIPETSAAHAAAAIERYNNDAVKEPERQSTTRSISRGGGSGN